MSNISESKESSLAELKRLLIVVTFLNVLLNLENLQRTQDFMALLVHQIQVEWSGSILESSISGLHSFQNGMYRMSVIYLYFVFATVNFDVFVAFTGSTLLSFHPD